MTHYIKSHLEKRVGTYIKIFSIVLLLTLTLCVVFFLTKGTFPNVSELSFIENSTLLGKKAGSVVPASCDSAPPANHFNGDCLFWTSVSLGFGSLPSSVNLIFSTNSHFAAYSTNPTFTWTVTGATECVASGGWSGSKSIAGGSESPTYTNPSLATQGTPTVGVTYTLSCSNNGKSIKTMAFIVYYYSYVDPGLR